jgi:hypothetical protein
MSIMPKTLSHVAESIHQHRADRAERHLLEHELAAYATPAERTDLEALLDQYPDAEAEPVREIVTRQAYRLAG